MNTTRSKSKGKAVAKLFWILYLPSIYEVTPYRSQRYYNKYQQKWETKWEEGPYTLDVFMNDVALQRLAHMGWPVRLKEVISTTDCATLCRINDSEATWQMDDNIFHGSIQDWSL